MKIHSFDTNTRYRFRTSDELKFGYHYEYQDGLVWLSFIVQI